MSDSVTRNINAAVQKTYEWIADLEQELGINDHQLAYQALRSVLHALRDRLPIEEAAHFAAELPVILRGVFYEGWQPAHKPEKLTPETFLERVIANYGAPACPEPLFLTRAVLALFDKRIASGEMADVRSVLPKNMDVLWQT